MNFLAPGLRELARLFDRSSCRLRLMVQRRKLAQLESKLGLLGWQQAEYDAGTQQHVDQLNDLERAQAQLTNQSAEIGVAIAKLEEKRSFERTAYEKEHETREAARAPLFGPVQETERVWNDKQRELKELGDRLKTLDRELTSNEEKYRALLAKGDHTPSQAGEVQRLQKRAIAIPQEKWQWQQAFAAIEAEIPQIEAELHQRRAMLSVETEALNRLETDFKKSDGALVDEIASRKREKQKLERENDALEKSKTQPYREIGRVLADHGIEPMNQPQALSDVLTQRERISAEQARLVKSREESGRERKANVWTAWVLMLSFAVLLWFAAWIALRSR